VRIPTARPAASRWSVPSVRSLLVAATIRFTFRIFIGPLSALS
jgi:hypothetical protein